MLRERKRVCFLFSYCLKKGIILPIITGKAGVFMKRTFLIAGVLLSIAVAGTTAHASDFVESNPAKAAGYYHSDEYDALLLPSSTGYSISAGTLEGPFEYSVLNNGDDFLLLLDEENDEVGCFVKQTDKAKTESGGIYYAVYGDCVGKAGEVDFKEGKQVQFGDYIFDNDYEVYVRDSLSVFFGVDGVTAGGVSGKIESDGFASPEEAVSAYIKGLQDNDLTEMLSAFAVETYAENYSLAKMVDRLQSYQPSLGFIPTISDFSLELNIEQRRTRITGEIRAHYLVLTNSASINEDNAGRPVILSDGYESGDDLVSQLFATEDETYLSDIRFEGKFYNPADFSENYLAETNQKNLGKQAAVIDADEIKSTVAGLASAGTEFVLCMDTVRYGDRWFVLDAGGNIGSLLGIDTLHAGLLPIPEDEAEEFHRQFD